MRAITAFLVLAACVPENGGAHAVQPAQLDAHWLRAAPTPVVVQRQEADCGLAALAMVAGAWGQPVSLADLAQRVPTRDAKGNGVKLGALPLAIDGRVVTVAELDDVVAAVPSSEHIVSYQLEQHTGGLRLRATTTGALDASRLAAALHALYGAAMPVAIEPVAALEPEPSGKYARVRQRLALDRAAWFAPDQRTSVG